MINSNQPWPLYDCNKQVRALRIKALSEPTLNEIKINIVTASFYEEGYPDLELLPIFMDKHSPHAGGYLVQYLNSAGEVEYTSFSPFDPFQSYTPAEPGAKSLAEQEERRLMDAFVRQRPENVRNRLIAHMIGKIFFYGDFKAETVAERELEALLIAGGFRYTTEAQVMMGVVKYEEGNNTEVSSDESEKILRSMVDGLQVAFPSTLNEILPWERAGQPLRQVTDVGFLRGAAIHLWSLLEQVSKIGNGLDSSAINAILRQRSQHLASDGKELYVVQK